MSPEFLRKSFQGKRLQKQFFFFFARFKHWIIPSKPVTSNMYQISKSQQWYIRASYFLDQAIHQFFQEEMASRYCNTELQNSHVHHYSVSNCQSKQGTLFLELSVVLKAWYSHNVKPYNDISRKTKPYSKSCPPQSTKIIVLIQRSQVPRLLRCCRFPPNPWQLCKAQFHYSSQSRFPWLFGL